MDRTQRTPFLVPQRTAVPAAGRSCDRPRCGLLPP